MKDNEFKKLKKRKLIDLAQEQQNSIDELEKELEKYKVIMLCQQRYIDEFNTLAKLNEKFSDIAEQMEKLNKPAASKVVVKYRKKAKKSKKAHK